MTRGYDEIIEKIMKWNSKSNFRKIVTINAHSAGEPLRIIISGFPIEDESTILNVIEKTKNRHDNLRTSLMWEPRGHADMYGCVLLPPKTTEADFGVMFLHNEGYSTMCGHAILAVTKVVLETGGLSRSKSVSKIKIDTPAGLVTSYATIENGKVSRVYFHNVPSFVLYENKSIELENYGRINVDVAFGGAFYAFVKAKEFDLEITPSNTQKFIKLGMEIKEAVSNKFKIIHPIESDLSFLYGTIFIGNPASEEADSRNVCIFANGEVDRCPTGTGVSARMALHYKKGEIKIGEKMVIESIIGSKYSGSVVETTKIGDYDAVIPQVEGTAYITGISEFLIDPEDPLQDGFLLDRF